MKKTAKRVVSLALALVMILSLALTAQAASGDQKYAVYNISVTEGYKLTPQTADGTTDTAVGDFYKQTVKFDLAITDGTEDQHVVFLLNDGGTVPNKNNIRYIDQNTGTVHFCIYPDTLAKTGTYNLYVVNGTERVLAAYFDVRVPGDVDSDGKVTVSDASLILQSLVGTATLDAPAQKAADVNGINGVDSMDASWILQKVVDHNVQFPVEGN